MKPDTVMIFAAGRGTRMRELTDDKPKPLIKTAGKALLDRALELADQADIPRKFINTNYLAHMVETHLKDRTDVSICEEIGEALETGGGLKHALPLIDRETVFTLNPDAVWNGSNPLKVLGQHWCPAKMDALLMLVPLNQATGHKYRGDFNIDEQGKISRFDPEKGASFVYTGAQIMKTAPVENVPQSRFSFNLVWDQLIAKDRVFACLHDGGWADVGSPEGLAHADAIIQVQT